MQKNAIIFKNSNLKLCSVLTTYRKSYMSF